MESSKQIFLLIQFLLCQEASWLLFGFCLFACLFVFMRMSVGKSNFHFNFFFFFFPDFDSKCKQFNEDKDPAWYMLHKKYEKFLIKRIHLKLEGDGVPVNYYVKD